MKLFKIIPLLILVFTFATIDIAFGQDTSPSHNVISRTIGEENADKFDLKIDRNLEDSYTVKVEGNKVHVTAVDQMSLCRGTYDYLTNACNSIVSWSGNNINIPEQLPVYTKSVKSPYKYHYYFNVVTHGYSTAYWDWDRWEKEFDWMAIHGINMPLLPSAHEAILYRVFKKLGLTDKEIDTYFTGPAFFPWNKMGNITGWDGPLPKSYFGKQVELNHKVLKRAKELDMHPIVQAFAGFVPEGIKRLYPNEDIRELWWGAFNRPFRAHILDPTSKLFVKIGKMYVEEYEKEFGKQEFYLADSFNEMNVPVSSDHQKALKELAGYGESVYRSINEANPDATWVMQGWTFPFHTQNGEKFWTPERLQALVSKVPDDKLLILDLANEYNRLWWKNEPSWKLYSGFFGKNWIYSFIPNMGGKTAFNGRLDLYATMPMEALKYSGRKNQVGFGFAPEGIENNEIIYELLSDIGWKSEEIDLDKWVSKYCTNRYGGFPESMKEAFAYFNKSCFGSFTDHPRNIYQFRPGENKKGSINTSEDYGKGVELFLKSTDELKNSELYKIDVLEFTSQYLGIKADEMIVKYQKTKDSKYLVDAIRILTEIDKLLVSHPNWKLQNWTEYARKWGDTKEEKDYYEANARRLITTWGGNVNDYAAKTWSGLIRDYYMPRWREYYSAKENHTDFDLLQWEENWIHSTEISKMKPYAHPLEKAKELFYKYY